MNRRDVGILGEKLAVNFLKRRGYSIRETNFRCKQGEIDIVSEKNDFLVFVEVRTKTNNDFGSPEESITHAKKEKVIASALAYISTHRNSSTLWRIDFVAVELDRNGKAIRIELFENAIS